MFGKPAPKTLRAIGPYDLLDKVADSSMSCIYKGRHRLTGDVVAVKILAPDLAQNLVVLKRFEQEFRTASSLDHPHLVRGLDFGREGASVYLVMEFVEGGSLGDRIEREGYLSEAEACRLIVQVAGALHQAHQRGIVHRDVKPDNILLTAAGQAKLADLGLVKDVNADLDLTGGATGLGTPNFMAPEQFDDAKHAGPPCDVYSLGATLYMAVTGELPFRAAHGNYLGVLKKKLTGQLPRPRQLVPALSERLDLAVRRALSVNPEGRPRSCPEFVDALTGSLGAGNGAAQAMFVQPVDPPRTARKSPVDRRRGPRYRSNRLVVSYAIGGAKECRWSGRIQDVSANGLCLLLERRFEPGTVLAVGTSGDNSSRAAPLLVRVVHVRPQPPGQWIVGCVFGADLDDSEVRALVELAGLTEPLGLPDRPAGHPEPVGGIV